MTDKQKQILQNECANHSDTFREAVFNLAEGRFKDVGRWAVHKSTRKISNILEAAGLLTPEITNRIEELNAMAEESL